MRSLHILFVDSDPNACARIQQVLGNGFICCSATSLSEAKMLLLESTPDILICEVLLGQENGLDLCRLARNTSSLRHLPIMLLTSLTTLQDKVAGFEAGADDYVVKPFDGRHLKARIRLLIRIKQLEKEDARSEFF